MYRTMSACPVPMTTYPQGPFGIIEIVAVVILILGILWLGVPMGMNLFHSFYGGLQQSIPQQLMNLFGFGVSGCFGLVLLHARGRLPYLEAGILERLIDHTFGNIPKLMGLRKNQSPKRSRNRSKANKDLL